MLFAGGDFHAVFAKCCQKVNFLFALVAALYLVLLTVDFVRYGGVVAPSWITAAFAIALGGWIGCRRSERLRGAARFCGAGRCVRRSACFSPPFPANFCINAVKTGHPTKIRMPGFFFMPVTVGAPPVPSPAWRDTRAMPVQPRTLSPAPAQSARQASAAAPPAPAPSAGSPPAGSMR